MKLKVQAQYLQPGDIVGSGEIVKCVVHQSIHWPSNKVCVRFWDKDKTLIGREPLWNKRTIINVERAE